MTARHKDGRAFPVDLAVSETCVKECRLFTGVVRDLPDRKRAEAELRMRSIQRTPHTESARGQMIRIIELSPVPPAADS